MQCPRCHHPNREEAAFWAECGAGLTPACGGCGRALRRDAKFCDGWTLEELTAAAFGPDGHDASADGNRRRMTTHRGDLRAIWFLQRQLGLRRRDSSCN